MLRRNLRDSYKQASKISSTADKTAFQNTIIALRDRYHTFNQQSKWIPKPINDQNSVFSSKVPAKKAMRKPGEAARVSINIFQLGSDFKPTVKRNELSVRSSNLFTDKQKEDRWRSSSKASEFRPLSGEYQRGNCFRKSVDHAGKHSSIDLSWNQCRNTKQANSITFNMKQMETKNQQKLFQNKKRTDLRNNYSSLQL